MCFLSLIILEEISFLWPILIQYPFHRDISFIISFRHFSFFPRTVSVTSLPWDLGLLVHFVWLVKTELSSILEDGVVSDTCVYDGKFSVQTSFIITPSTLSTAPPDHSKLWLKIALGRYQVEGQLLDPFSKLRLPSQQKQVMGSYLLLLWLLSDLELLSALT